MPKTNMQTVEVLFPWSKKIHYTMALRPILPAPLEDLDESVGIADGEKVTIWWWDGPTCVYHQDGTIHRFWPKPTLADAVAASKTVGYEGCSFRFHTSGVVEEVYQGNNFCWSADMDGAEAEGVTVLPEGYCDTTWFEIFGERLYFEPNPYGFVVRNCHCYDCKESAGVFDSERAPTRF